MVRVYVKKANGERVLKNFKKEENARKCFDEWKQKCGDGTRAVNSGLDYKFSTGVAVKYTEWGNGDRLELISYHC